MNRKKSEILTLRQLSDDKFPKNEVYPFIQIGIFFPFFTYYICTGKVSNRKQKFIK
ncbi:MAG: hypothetical protein LBD59_09640 [Prevotellaceae bacterium]|nr:hypothetical protein [Prevotellaceae bacterium]